MSLITPAGLALPCYCWMADQAQYPEITAAISVPLFFTRRSFRERQHGEASCCGGNVQQSLSLKLKQISYMRYRSVVWTQCCQCYYIMNHVWEARQTANYYYIRS